MPILNFRGREEIYSHHLGTSFRPLVVDPKKSLLPLQKTPPVLPTLDNNLIIHGDNLYALKALMPRYAGRIKCIYIDPPYNTGNEKWVFNDNVNNPMMKEWLGKAVDIEDLQRHDKWLCMMWPRLQLMKELLAEDGVLICAIDHNEQEHLGLLLKEVFQEQEIVCVTVVHNPRGIQGDNFSYTHDYAYFVLPNKNGNNIEVEIGKDFGFYKTVWTGSQYDANEYGTKLLKNIIPNCPFNYPKSLFTVKECLKAVCVDDKNALILDSFAGSGTTAHAVLDLNKEDGGNRKFILIECEDYAHNITAERVRRVIKGYEQTKEHKTVLWTKKLNINTLENIKNQNKKDILDECVALQKKHKQNFDEIIKEYKKDRLQLIGRTKTKQKKPGLTDYFTYCSLGPAMDEESLLKGKALPDYPTLASYTFYTATGKTLNQVQENENFYVSKANKHTAVFVIYKPDVPFLRSQDSALHEARKEQIEKVMFQKDANKALVFATDCFYDEQNLKQAGITFCQLPFAIYQKAQKIYSNTTKKG